MSSDRVDQLDASAEVFYRRLMSKVDDYGLFDARLNMLRSSLYPLRVDRVREADISRWIAACEKAGLIALYSHDGKPYGQMLDTEWQTRSEPKQPLPPWGKGKPPRATENSCEHEGTDAPVFVFGDVVGDGDVLAPTVLVGRKAPDTKLEPYRVPPCPYEALVEAYAKALPALPQITVLNDSRKGHARARWGDVCGADKFTAEQGIEFFVWYFCHVASSPFLTGQGKPNKEGRVWRADFDWLLLPTNFAKVVEGRYHGKAAA